MGQPLVARSRDVRRAHRMWVETPHLSDSEAEGPPEPLYGVGRQAVLHARADDDPLENSPLAEQRDGAVSSALSLPAPVPPVAGEQGHGPRGPQDGWARRPARDDCRLVMVEEEEEQIQGREQ